jgi:hypothetical protein
MSAKDFISAQSTLVAAGVQIDVGLTPEEFNQIQQLFGFEFPPDLREFLSVGLPISHNWVDWRRSCKFIHVLRMSGTGKCNWAEVTCKVKDFDAWLKVFDGEGAATRKKDGLIDIVLARGIEDPNWVYLVFQINSVAEANAALANPARQKLMEESGVEGKPAVYFGSDQ